MLEGFILKTCNIDCSVSLIGGGNAYVCIPKKYLNTLSKNAKIFTKAEYSNPALSFDFRMHARRPYVRVSLG